MIERMRAIASGWLKSVRKARPLVREVVAPPPAPGAGSVGGEVEENRTGPVPGLVLGGAGEGIDGNREPAQPLGNDMLGRIEHLRRGAPPVRRSERQRVDHLREGHRRVDQREKRHPREAPVRAGEAQEGPPPLPRFRGVHSSGLEREDHPALGLVAQESRHRLRDDLPAGKDEPLRQLRGGGVGERALGRVVVGERGREPEEPPRPAAHRLVRQVPEPGVARVDLSVRGDGVAVEQEVRVGAEELRQLRPKVGRVDRGRRGRNLPEHPAARLVHRQPLGPAHHLAQPFLDLRLEGGEATGRPGAHPEKLAAELLQQLLQLGGLRLVVRKEPVGPDEVLVVVLASVLVAQGEHLVGRGGKEEDPRVAPLEEVPGEHRRVVLAVEEVAEPLELVEDNQVGLESFETGGGTPPPTRFPEAGSSDRCGPGGSRLRGASSRASPALPPSRGCSGG
ncbi:MAG: hypothetical protein IPP07_08055 [Holophagales bacterium]|nr:hypothetical protein [Holophagales bacterium]